MKKTLLVLSLLTSSYLFAQDQTVKGLQTDAGKTIKKDASDTATKTWKKGGIFSINVSQGSLSNWAAGGDNFSLSLNSYVNLFAFYKKGRHSWDNNVDMYLGYINTTSLGARKNDDRFNFTSKYGYALNPKLNLSGLLDFRTQFFKGYNYDKTPKILSSDFLAPAYLLLSPGLDWHPVPKLSVFFSPITARWLIVNNQFLADQKAYGVDSGKTSKMEYGAFATVQYEANLNKTVTYKGRLDLFSNYRHNPQNVDIYLTNLFAVKLSRVLSATWSLDFIYDDDAKFFGPDGKSVRAQIKSLIGVGLLVKL